MPTSCYDSLCLRLIVRSAVKYLLSKEIQTRITNLCGHDIIELITFDIDWEVPLNHIVTHHILNMSHVLYWRLECANHVARPFLILGKAAYLHSVDAFVVFYAMVVCLVELHLSGKEIKRSQSDAQSKHIEGIGQLVRSYLVQ